jgi:hypothetical protein
VPINPVSSVSRTGITAPDADASALGVFIAAPAQSVRLGATVDAPGASLKASVYFLDASESPICVQRIGFTSPAAPDWGKGFVATPDYDPCWPLGGAKALVVKVDGVSGGTWSINGITA